MALPGPLQVPPPAVRLRGAVGAAPADGAAFPAFREGAGVAEAFLVLEAVGSVIDRHGHWMGEWHTSVISALTANGTEEAPVPGEAAPAGQGKAPLPRPHAAEWIRALDHPMLRHHPRFDALARELSEMAEEADVLARTVADTGRILAPAYGAFVAATQRITAHLLEIERDMWNRVANVDPLTGLGNRQAMWCRLVSECERHGRSRHPCSVAMIDVDTFKEINDAHGHGAGDAVLVWVAAQLASALRPYDAVFRFGGDEFAVCLPDADLRAAWAIIERLRLKVSAGAIAIANGVEVRTTISCGIAALDSTIGVAATLERADRALYRAKRDGRNRIRVATEALPDR